MSYCENLELGGKTSWRLPNVKELQLLVDYTKSPQTTSSAAIDPIFQVSEITVDDYDVDYPNFP